MRFGLLGPLEIRGDETGPIEIRGTKLRTLFAALALRANTPVPTDILIDLLWEDDSPTAVVGALHNLVLRLRRSLGDEGAARLRAVAPGYELRIQPGELDIDTFEEHCAAGQRQLAAERWPDALDRFTAALALWRGDPLVDVPNLAAREARTRQLGETRRRALESRFTAALRLGHHADLVGELMTVVDEHPLNETFHEQLILALAHTGQRAEALRVFRDLRRNLVDQLGVEPGRALQELHSKILKEDSGPDRERAGQRRASAGSESSAARSQEPAFAPPQQLPTDTRNFVGRKQELAVLFNAALQPAKRSGNAEPAARATGDAAVGQASFAVTVCLIDGMGGSGKTALAVHAAHRLTHQYPDGQLFLDLQGHTPGLAPLSIEDALDVLLRSLGVAPEALPRQRAEKAVRYRSLLAGTRTLIIFDNAYSASQVRSLLPGNADCLVLVTSRKRLTSLDDAHLVSLGSLAHHEAAQLLRSIAGPDRVADDDTATGELLRLCGYLPLAIRITAARLRHRSTLQAQDLVDEFKQEADRLTHLKDDERDLIAVFGSSFANLPSTEQRLFRQLGLIPGPNFDAYATGHLSDAEPKSITGTLDTLLDYNLLLQHGPDRYQMHDLVRAYAQSLAVEDAHRDGEAARDRLFAYYEHAAIAANRHMTRLESPNGLTTVTPLVESTLPDLSDLGRALAWFRTERANLLAAAASPAIAPARLFGLLGAMATFLWEEGPWSEAADLHKAAVSKARDLGNELAEANALRDLGNLEPLFESTNTSTLEAALAIYRKLGERRGVANVLYLLGQTFAKRAELKIAKDHYEQALRHFRDIRYTPGEAYTIYQLGVVERLSANFEASIASCQRAQALFEASDDRIGVALSHYELSYAYHESGDLPAARSHSSRALEMYRELGMRRGEANALWQLTDIYFTLGEHKNGEKVAKEALAIFQELGNRFGEAAMRFELGRIYYVFGDYSAAVPLLERAFATLHEMGVRYGESAAEHWLGKTKQALGDYEAADGHLARALSFYREVGEQLGTVELLNCVAELRADTERHAEALEFHKQALDLARKLPSALNEARSLEGMARRFQELGDHVTARSNLSAALTIYRDLNVVEVGPAEAFLKTLPAAP
jgi:DNA-binding SARP family transcriptional activator/tetratricopeptide (TPR) repeat protein